MGGIAKGFVAYAQILIDDTDGSQEQINWAMAIAQMCWALAIVPDDDFPDMLVDFQQTLKMDEQKFLAFTEDIILPMIARHHEMFPHMHNETTMAPVEPYYLREGESSSSDVMYAGTPRNAPCPCNSGKKYKRCCGQVH